jgi:hypothetical protein
VHWSRLCEVKPQKTGGGRLGTRASIAAFTLPAAIRGALFGYEVSETRNAPNVNCRKYFAQHEEGTAAYGLYNGDGGLEHGCVSGMGAKVFIDLEQNTKPEAGSVARKIGENAQQEAV